MKVVSRFGGISGGMVLILVLVGCGSASYFRAPGGEAGADGRADAGETGVIFIGMPSGGTGGVSTTGEGSGGTGGSAGALGGATVVETMVGATAGSSTGEGGGGGSGPDGSTSPSGAAGAAAPASGGASQSGGQPGSSPGRNTGGSPASGGSPGAAGKAPSSADGGSGGSSRGGTGGEPGSVGGPAPTGGGGAGASPTTGPSGGRSGTAGAGAAGSTVSLDSTKFSFEPPYSSSDPSAPYQLWRAVPGSPPFESVQPTDAFHFLGTHALAGQLNATSPQVYDVGVLAPRVPPGATVTFHVLVPAGSTVSWVEPYVQQGPPSDLLTGTMVPIGQLSIDAWNTLTVGVPARASPLQVLGVRFNVSGPWRGAVYIDSVDW